MTTSEIRTQFGRIEVKGARVVAMVLGVLLGVCSAYYAVSLFVSNTRFPSAVLFIILGPAITLVCIDALHTSLRGYRLSLGANGIVVRTRWREVVIPWADIESWWVGVPGDFFGRFAKREMVLATPAAHITDPKEGPRRVLWSRRYRNWVICQPALTDGTTEEVVAALKKFAANKLRAAQ